MTDHEDASGEKAGSAHDGNGEDANAREDVSSPKEEEGSTQGVAEFLTKALADPKCGITVYLQNCIVGAARQNSKRSAYVQFAIDDEAVVNMIGSDQLRDWWMLLRIPRELVERVKQKPFSHL